MQITLVSSGDTVSDVLNQFEKNFFNWVEIQERFSRWTIPVSGYLLVTSIRELKAMVDYLTATLNVVGLDAPKRNSKLSLADWIARVLLSAREMAETSGAIATQPTEASSPDLTSKVEVIADVLPPRLQLLEVSPVVEVQAQETKTNQSISSVAKIEDFTFLELLDFCRVTLDSLPVKTLKQMQELWTNLLDLMSKTDRSVPCGHKRHRSTWVSAIVDELRRMVQVRSMARIPGGLGYIKESLWDFSVVLADLDGFRSLLEALATEVTATKEPIAPQSADTLSETDSTSGLIISFGKTLEYLPQKSVTRRTWKDGHAQKFINAFSQNKLVKALDKDPRYGGKQIGWCRLLCAPYKEQLCDMPSEDLLAEGGMCDTIGAFVQQYFDGNPRLEVWVIRFEFIADSVLATETNPVVVVADQVVNFSSPQIEILEPEEKPVYQISIHSARHADKKGWGFTERVSALPPYLLDREGNLFERSSYTVPSCDASYAQITSQHLSNIAEEHGQVIELMTDDLVVYRVNVHGNPPPYVVHKRGVYKRMTWGVISLGSIAKYAQVVSECLSNIVVV